MFYDLNGLQMGMTRLKKRCGQNQICIRLWNAEVARKAERDSWEDVPQQSGFTINQIHDMERGMCDICII